MATPVVSRIIEGTASLTSSLEYVSITVSPAPDLTKTFFSISANGGDYSAANSLVSAYWFNASVLRIYRGFSYAGTSVSVRYKIVEFSQGVSVQNGRTTMQSQSSKAITINSVTQSKSIAMITYSYDGSDGIDADKFLRARLTAATTLTIDRNASEADVQYVSWQVVSFEDYTVTAFAASSSSAPIDVNITSASLSALSKALVFFSYYFSSGSSSDGRNFRGASLTSTTNARLYSYAGSGITYSLFIVKTDDNCVAQHGVREFTAATPTDLTITAADTSKSLHFNNAAYGYLTPADSYEESGPITMGFLQLYSSTALRTTKVDASNKMNMSWTVATINGTAGDTPLVMGRTI